MSCPSPFDRIEARIKDRKLKPRQFGKGEEASVFDWPDARLVSRTQRQNFRSATLNALATRSCSEGGI